MYSQRKGKETYFAFSLNIYMWELEIQFTSVQFSRTVVSNSSRPHELQHARPHCPSPIPGVHPNPCPLSWWSHPTISSSVDPFSCPQSFPASGSFQMSLFCASGGQSTGVSALASVFPMNTQGLISFRMDWLDLLVVQGTLKSLSNIQFKSISSSALNFLYSLTLTSIHDYWKNHSFDSMDLCWQSNVSAF